MENEEEGCSGNHIGMDWNFGGNGKRRHLTLIAFAASLGLLDTLKDFHTLKFQMKSQKKSRKLQPLGNRFKTQHNMSLFVQ